MLPSGAAGGGAGIRVWSTGMKMKDAGRRSGPSRRARTVESMTIERSADKSPPDLVGYALPDLHWCGTSYQYSNRLPPSTEKSGPGSPQAHDVA
jgi:hypothetical protein